MNFENDVFISYAHFDDETLSEELKGWITEFHIALEVRLKQLLGEKPVIWRDLKLQGNDYFAPEIEQKFPKLKVMVSVITPRYVKSEWCQKEVDLFFKAADSTGGVAVNNKARIFKVIKTPVELNEQPPKIRPLLGYEFYKKESASNRTIELGLFKKEDAYWDKLNDVAYNIADLLKIINARNADGNGNGKATAFTPAPGSEAPGRKIFLAETSSDLKDYRNKLKRELETNGHTIFPDKNYEPVAEEYRKEIEADMNDCSLSIHLLGSKYGFIPEGIEQKSIVEIQNEVAAQLSVSRGLNRLIWMPELTATDDARVIKLAESLNKENLQEGSDLLKGPIENFGAAIFDTIKKLDAADKEKEIKKAAEKTRAAAISSASKALSTGESDEEPKTIFLISDDRDKDSIKPLYTYLFKTCGFNVDKVTSTGTVDEIKSTNENSLRDCDAVVIYYGQGSEGWLKAKVGEVKRKPALADARPMKAAMIFKGSPSTPEKEDYDIHNFEVVDGIAGFNPDVFQNFVSKLK